MYLRNLQNTPHPDRLRIDVQGTVTSRLPTLVWLPRERGWMWELCIPGQTLDGPDIAVQLSVLVGFCWPEPQSVRVRPAGMIINPRHRREVVTHFATAH